MAAITEEDYFTSCMGTLITSNTFTSFVAQAAGNTRLFANQIVIKNAHATADSIINIISGGQVVANPYVQAKQTVELDYGELGIPMSLNSGMEVQALTSCSYTVQARMRRKNVLP